ncbi:uncharacterized protein LOC108627514 [Ceratina calcarata]|uniref:Uncharacterized protein LOC108627514 n=1 Tax=Ceratina calcarata TaxID=156304 RepID=A0AAJ7S641_9HYME|nr:uncharacterized protein LOC108627514 [Ceratina calcarata]
MSQVCPSSSHQLVAATVAFRRARRKFPKNYGLCCNVEETTKSEKTESVSENEDQNEQETSQFSSGKCSNGRPHRVVEAKILWNDECGENGSIKENFLQKPIICSCCRKRNQCSAGDTLDIVPSKEYNGIAKKTEVSKSDQLENCDTKTMRSFVMESVNFGRARSSCSHPQRRSLKESSVKLGSVNLLYDRDQNEVDNVKSTDSPERRKCTTENRDSNTEGRVYKSINHNSRCTFAMQKDNSSSNSRSCNHCVKHSNLDLLRPRQGCHQSRHRCCHSHHCHHCCENECGCSSKETRLNSETCLCAAKNTNNHTRRCRQEHGTRDTICSCNYCAKDSEKISAMQELNDEELDDSVGTINHKDSLCILVEKYKANKKCKHKSYFGEAELANERVKDECNKSFTSETTCQMDEINVTGKRGGKYSNNINCRASMGKACRHECRQIFREGERNDFKNLKSRLIKTGTCYSAKGTPWRHTF